MLSNVAILNTNSHLELSRARPHFRDNYRLTVRNVSLLLAETTPQPPSPPLLPLSSTHWEGDLTTPGYMGAAGRTSLVVLLLLFPWQARSSSTPNVLYSSVRAQRCFWNRLSCEGCKHAIPDQWILQVWFRWGLDCRWCTCTPGRLQPTDCGSSWTSTWGLPPVRSGGAGDSAAPPRRRNANEALIHEAR